MTQHQYVLSICIPTFNRLHYLKESLDILLPQTQRLSVEICVSDNHSTDDTARYLAAISGSFSSLRYVIQSENIGLDKNMAAVISMGKGRFIYPLGDDDLLPEGCLLAILTEISEDTNVDIILLNGWHTDPFILPIREHLSPDMQGRQFLTPDAAFYSLWDKMPFGSFIASKKCFSKHHFNKFIGTSHAYTGAVWDMLAEKYQETGGCKVKCMSTPTVLLRGAEKTWSNDAARIMLYEIPLYFSILPECYQETGKQILSDYLKVQLSISKLLTYRATCQLNSNLAIKLKCIIPNRHYIKVKFIIIIPTFIARLFCISGSVLYRIYRYLNKLN